MGSKQNSKWLLTLPSPKPTAAGCHRRHQPGSLAAASSWDAAAVATFACPVTWHCIWTALATVKWWHLVTWLIKNHSSPPGRRNTMNEWKLWKLECVFHFVSLLGRFDWLSSAFARVLFFRMAIEENHVLEVSVSEPENGLTVLEEMSVCHPWCFRDSHHCRHQTCHGQFGWESQETYHCENSC